MGSLQKTYPRKPPCMCPSPLRSVRCYVYSSLLHKNLISVVLEKAVTLTTVRNPGRMLQRRVQCDGIRCSLSLVSLSCFSIPESVFASHSISAIVLGMPLSDDFKLCIVWIACPWWRMQGVSSNEKGPWRCAFVSGEPKSLWASQERLWRGGSISTETWRVYSEIYKERAL